MGCTSTKLPQSTAVAAPIGASTPFTSQSTPNTNKHKDNTVSQEVQLVAPSKSTPVELNAPAENSARTGMRSLTPKAPHARGHTNTCAHSHHAPRTTHHAPRTTHHAPRTHVLIP